MATKTWKLGEVAIGGKIKVSTNDIGGQISVEALDYFTGKEVCRKVFNIPYNTNDIELYLGDLTSSYYAEKIFDWIKTKITFTDIGW